jgi:predicted Na+-dependent transporter
MVLRSLIFIAINGRYTLVAGLVAGFLLPTVSIIIKDLLPQFVALLLFLTAFRIGHKKVVSSFQKLSLVLLVVLTLQLMLPLLAVGILSSLQLTSSIFAIALTLILAAPSITGAPNFAILLNSKPEPAFQALIIGTALLPFTVIPIFWIIPGLGGFIEVFSASFHLFITIFLTTLLGFLVRALVFPKLDEDLTTALDGITALTLAFMVIGLMAALRPALISDPLSVAKWLVFALLINLGLQFITFHLLKLFKLSEFAAPIGIVSGNRNIALYLVALPIMQSEQLLIFLGCYQIPMYLTPIIMRKVYSNSSYDS